MAEFVTHVEFDKLAQFLKKIEESVQNGKPLNDIYKDIKIMRINSVLNDYTYFEEFCDLIKAYTRKYKNFCDSNNQLIILNNLKNSEYAILLQSKSQFLNPISCVAGLFSIDMKRQEIDSKRIITIQPKVQNGINLCDIFRWSRWWLRHLNKNEFD